MFQYRLAKEIRKWAEANEGNRNRWAQTEVGKAIKEVAREHWKPRKKK